MNPRSQPEVVHAAPQPATPRKPPDVKPPVAGPRQPERAIAASSTPNPALEPLTCRHCRSINVIAVFKKDYCLECSECGKFTPLDYTCPACHTRAPIRKSGPEFRRECPCGHAAVFWRNT